MRQLYCFIIFIFITIIVLLTILSLKRYDFSIDKYINGAKKHYFTNAPMDTYTRCLFDMEQALNSLSIPWFVTFGSALMYWRSKNFISDDMDLGIFYEDFLSKNYSESYFLSVIKDKHHFKLRSTYGSINHGKEWTFLCPKSEIRIDIFFFYAINETNSSYSYWAASYNGLCDKLPYKKCRWGYSNFNVTTFEMYGKVFHIVPTGFLIDQYGKDYMTPKRYGYFESLSFLPNLISDKSNG